MPGIRWEAGIPERAISTAQWTGEMPMDFGSSSVADYTFSIYAIYSTGSPSARVSGGMITSRLENTFDPENQISTYPNPFVDQLNIDLAINQDNSYTRLNIFDETGRFVTTLIESRLARGTHRLKWDGMSGYGTMSKPGLYILTVEVEGKIITERIILK